MLYSRTHAHTYSGLMVIVACIHHFNMLYIHAHVGKICVFCGHLYSLATKLHTKQLSFSDMRVHKSIECLAFVCCCFMSFTTFNFGFSGWYFRVVVVEVFFFYPITMYEMCIFRMI